MKIKKITFLIFTIFLIFSKHQVEAEESEGKKEKYIVQFNKTIREETILENGGKIKNKVETINSLIVEIEDEKAEKLKNNPEIKAVTKDEKGEASEVTTQVSSWGAKVTMSTEAHKQGLTGKGVKIAILDTGISPHQDVLFTEATSFVDGEDAFDYVDGHGTHIAGIISAEDNEEGVVGIAPDSEIYSMKVANENGAYTQSAVLLALNECIRKDIDIINMSFHFPVTNSILDDMFQIAKDNGIILVAASGNGDKNHIAYNNIEYPANNPNVIAVGSVDENLQRSIFSNYGEGLDFVAPGNNIYSTFLNRGYDYSTGTSMATPHVVGIIALYKEKYPNYNNNEILQAVKDKALDLGELGYDLEYGYGLAQAPLIEASDIGKPLASLVNNRFVLYKGTDYPSRLFDDNKNNYATMANNGEVVIRFENPIQPAGIEMLFRDKSSISNLRVTVYDKQRNPIQTLSVLEQGIYTYQNLTDDIYFVGLKNISGKAVDLAEFEVLGQVESNPKKVMNFHTTLTLKKDLRWFMGEDFDLSDILPKLGVKDKTFTVDKGTDWSDSNQRFSKVRVTNEELGIVNKWVTVEYGELPEIYENDLTDSMYGQIVQDDGLSGATYLYNNNIYNGVAITSNKGITYEFDNPVTITHMYANYRPDSLDNQLKIIFTDADGRTFEEEIGDTQLFYRYFPFSQSYENVKKVRIQNISTNPIHLWEAGFYGTPNEERGQTPVLIERPITIKKGKFDLYDAPRMTATKQEGIAESNIVVQSIQGYGLKTLSNQFEWMQIEWNGELKWVTPAYQKIEFKNLYENGTIDAVGITLKSSNKVSYISYIADNSVQTATIYANGFVEYAFTTPTSVSRLYISSGKYIDNEKTNLLLELLDENKEVIYSKVITRDDLYKRFVPFDQTVQEVNYFKLTNLANETKTINELEFD